MADEETDFAADFLAMSWQVPAELEMLSALFTPTEDNVQPPEVAPAAEFPPQPPPEPTVGTHTGAVDIEFEIDLEELP